MTDVDLTPARARRLLGGLAPQHADDESLLERAAAVIWSHLIEPGDSAAGRLVAELGAVAGLRVLGSGDPVSSLSAQELGAARRRWLPRLSLGPVDDSLRIAERAGLTLVTRADPEWPDQLDDLDVHSPMCLWVRGDPSVLQRLRPSVALVGARAATSYGEHVALELAAELAGGGIPVVSGAAYGIDGAAHRAAIAVGGVTIALLAGGAERAYPAGHTQLIERIARSGAVVSEVPCGAAPTKWRFLQRNRLIAALTDATVVVEAGWRSGSLNTAGHAATLARQIGAVPGPITSAASAGSHRLMREYGAACITSADDIREMLGLSTVLDVPQDGRPRTDDRARVRDALSTRAWRDADDIARRAGMTSAEVEGILGLLRLEGVIERGSEGWRSVRS